MDNRQQKTDEAIDRLLSVIKEDGEKTEHMINLSVLLFERGAFEEAEGILIKKFEDDSNDFRIPYTLGSFYYNKAIFDKALELYRQAYELKQDDKDLNYMLAQTLSHTSMTKLALPYYMTAFDLCDSYDEDVYFQYALNLAQNDMIDEAQPIFENIIKKNDQHDDAYYNLALIHYYREQFDIAEHSVTKALAINPNHFLALKLQSSL
ncbi:tetratricopeptide repeat protein [Abyssicoccus albus]|uniref:tetratricopeptide repeat protein n=1 Tax=Abyssicoccus albus TaxID=1817405 RepID=UPI00097E2189|nr:tetratricopeptide repeat protein [Abyssicoccus albus]AQL56017.1 hypothetical protein BVH56_03320 [Abyssicoccus albus]